jgi:hypothetical protein
MSLVNLSTSAMAVVVPMAEEVHQRAGQKDEEGEQLREMLAVAEEEPPDRRCQADPEQPLIDAGPIQPARGFASAIVETCHGDSLLVLVKLAVVMRRLGGVVETPQTHWARSPMAPAMLVPPPLPAHRVSRDEAAS